MKVLAFVGSPRKGGNTDIVVDKLLEGARTRRNVVEKIYLYDLEIRPCVDCRNCKKGNFECATKDDMQSLYPKLTEADILIFGSPLYWYGPTAKMKLFVDRLRPYVKSKKLEGKKAVLIVPSEEGENACKHLVGMFELSFWYLGIQLVNSLLIKAYEKGEVKDQPIALKKAYNIGKSFS